MSGRGQADRAVRLMLGGGIATIAVLATVLSPIAFEAILRRTHVAGADLSNAGQAYGGISALLSLLAVGGVIYATILQLQDQREGRLAANRNLHVDLIQLGIEKPGFLEVWQPIRDDPFDSRRIAYANLITTYWWHQYLVGVVRLDELRWDFENSSMGRWEGNIGEMLAATVFGKALLGVTWRTSHSNDIE